MSSKASDVDDTIIQQVVLAYFTSKHAPIVEPRRYRDEADTLNQIIDEIEHDLQNNLHPRARQYAIEELHKTQQKLWALNKLRRRFRRRHIPS